MKKICRLKGVGLAKSFKDKKVLSYERKGKKKKELKILSVT